MANEGGKTPKRTAKKSAKKTVKKAARKVSGLEKKRAEARQAIINRATVDPAFRERLFKNPARVFGTKLTPQDRAALRRIQAALPLLDAQLTHLAGTILCVDDPPDPPVA